MPDMHLRQSGFTYSACGSYSAKEKYESLKKQEIHDIFLKMN